MSFSCIIPFYNEQGRVDRVVATLLNSNFIQEIICVDDGSTDNGHHPLKKLSSKVKVLRLNQNLGKAQAVKAALPLVNHDNILLMDADLSNLDIDVIDTAANYFGNQSKHQMIIFQMTKFLITSRMIRGDILFSGIRLVKQSVLAHMFALRHVKGYQLELALNDYCLRYRLPVITCPLAADSVFSIDKLGWWATLRRDFHTYPSAIAHVGMWSFIKQLVIFGREQLDLCPSKTKTSPLRT